MIVRQISNALDLLEYFARTKKPASMGEVSTALGWPRSSAFNVLTTLAKRGFLCEPSVRGEFYPSPRWMSLAQAIAETDLIPVALCKAADDLAKQTGETAMIGGAVGIDSIYLYLAESSAKIRYTAQVGTQMPIHATAIGRALLAQYSPTERASLLRKIPVFEKYPNRRSPQNIPQVEEELKQAAMRGWHENVGTQSTEHTGVAIAAGLPGRRLAICVAGPTDRMRQRIPQLAAAMKRLLKKHLSTKTT